jgi:hypothetical protein
MTGRIRRVGNVRLPDDQRSTWNVTRPNSIVNHIDDDQGMREAPGPVVTESHMSAMEPPKTPKTCQKHAKNTPIRSKKPKIRAVLPHDADMSAVVHDREVPLRTVFNMRIPTKLLQHYRESGPNTSARIIAVLEMFVREGGEFVGGD